MLDPASDMLPPPSSPTNTSVTSSDLDTESTGSFFHDRSTTLGTLMGVTFSTVTFRAPSQHRDGSSAAFSATTPAPASKKKKKRTPAAAAAAERRRRRWWSLCRDGGAKPASLGEFLEVERRFGDGAFFGGDAAELEGVMSAQRPSSGGINERVLFADGRVLPPADVAGDDRSSSSTGGSLCRFPVSLTGICSGGGG